MTLTEHTAFNDANQTVHPVETQWHFPILTKYGFTPTVLSQVGFVRKYSYKHPDTDVVVTCNTGASADYWSSTAGGHGYWSDLEGHAKSLVCELVV